MPHRPAAGWGDEGRDDAGDDASVEGDDDDGSDGDGDGDGETSITNMGHMMPWARV